MKAHLDLFSGIGGFALSARWCGYQTVAFCEIDPYAQRVLQKNFGAVMADAEQCPTVERREPSMQRGRTGEAEQTWMGSEPRIFPDITKLDGTRFRGVNLLTAGVPCQPASVAGKRRGSKDDRWLWPEALRILRESSPAWAIFENPPGILSLDDGVEFERVLSEMEGAGYTVQPIIVPACAVDARHRRDRVWIVAHSEVGTIGTGFRETGPEFNRHITSDSGSTLAHANDTRSQGRNGSELPERGGERPAWESGSFCTWKPESEWFAESGMGRVASRIPSRVDRLRCLGNSVVPAVAAQIIGMIP